MRLRYAFAFCITLLTLAGPAWAQLGCGFDIAHAQRLEVDPAFRRRVEAMNRSIRAEQMSNRRRAALDSNAVDTIAVVFHVLHTGQALGSDDNPTDLSIRQGLDVLNHDYRGGNGRPNFRLHFVLAKTGPDCAATTGIERINAASQPGFLAHGVASSASDDGLQVPALNATYQWPPSDYYNIYLVPQITSSTPIGGFAFFPGGSASYDCAILISNQFMYSLDTLSGYRILSHEMGHAVGLYHTFQDGCSNSDCSADGDLVCDTDPQTQVSSGCPTALVNPCTNRPYGDHARNIMGYTTCEDLFTDGQMRRARAAVEYYRGSLFTSKARYAPQPYVAPVLASACRPTTNQSTNTFGIGPREVQIGSLASVTSGYQTGASLVDYTQGSCVQDAQVLHLKHDTLYTLTVSTYYNAQNVRAWIDYNNDGQFSTAERVLAGTTVGNQDFEDVTARFTVPATAQANTLLRMRVVADFASTSTIAACGPFEYGQAEDYAVTIEPLRVLPMPVIGAIPLLCPGARDTLRVSGGPFDTYQWIKDGADLPDATDSIYPVEQFADAGSNFQVRVTKDTDTATSPERLVDGWAFANIGVEMSGNFATDLTDGTAILCQTIPPAPDTLLRLTVSLPYHRNVRWFRNDTALADTGITLPVFSTGAYSVQGYTDVCPSYGQHSLAVGVRLQQIALPTVRQVGGLLVVDSLPADATELRWLRDTTAIAGATNDTLQPTRPGTYSLIFRTDYCLYATEGVTFSVTGLADLAGGLRLFPNPTQGLVEIQGTGPVDVTVRSLTGAAVRSFASVKQFSLVGLPEGLYSVALSTPGGSLLKVVRMAKTR